jgi:predicted DsbA family dithiol-disulfide isomerase
MSGPVKTLTFYHSALCPRCQMAGRSLSALLAEFPDIRLEKVEYLTNMRRSREAGVRSIPAMVSGASRLSGFYLTRKRIREFLATL